MTKFEEVVFKLPHPVQCKVNIDRNDDVETVTFVKDENGEVIVSLTNTRLKWSRELARYRDQRWSYIALERFHEFLELTKNYKAVHKGLKKVLRMSNIDPSFTAQIKCGKRRLTVTLVRMYYKLTH
jgi:hypothetical protein